ncbi:hypothetical protein GCM10027299_13550 [Larkinella ripae]
MKITENKVSLLLYGFYLLAVIAYCELTDGPNLPLGLDLEREVSKMVTQDGALHLAVKSIGKSEAIVP